MISLHISTNEIPGELSRENMIIFISENNMCFLLMKRLPLVWPHNKTRLSQQKIK